MATPVLEELRLSAFKTYRGAKLPIDAITVLTGRNSAGKSNALDGLEVLSRLATGEELGDALDGRRRQEGPVRGGSAGCAPHGLSYFELGCSVRNGTNSYHLDVRVQVRPELRITRERLAGPGPAMESGRIDQRLLLETRPVDSNSSTLMGEVHNGWRGVNPALPFRDSRLLTSQIPFRISPSNAADQAVIDGAETVLSALRSVFHLDPVPHLMRDYVPERSRELSRTGDNLSAALFRLREDDVESFSRLIELVKEVADDRVRDISLTRSDLGDVMLALREGPRKTDLTPAREMSDGLLRFIAIATSLLTSNRSLDIDPGVLVDSPPSGLLLVIEELENGLHPSQAGRMLQLVKDAAKSSTRKVMVTTHSPALLNAMTGLLNRSIVVCYRNGKGVSDLSRLTDLPGYAEAMAGGRLGDAITRGHLVGPNPASPDSSELNRLLGID